MTLIIRPVGKNYKDVEVKIDNSTISMGLLNREECLDLARELKDAMYHLLNDADYTKIMNEE